MVCVVIWLNSDFDRDWGGLATSSYYAARLGTSFIYINLTAIFLFVNLIIVKPRNIHFNNSNQNALSKGVGLVL